MIVLGVAVLAGIGASTRYVVDRRVQRVANFVFPIGTLVVNASASFILGVVAGAAASHGFTGSGLTLVSTGFVGGYSTFSTLVWETLALAETRTRFEALVNVAGTFAIGLVAVAAGYGVGLL